MSSNPYLRRIAKRGTTAHGSLSERRVAKGMGARLHAASGAMAGLKSDASLTEDRFRLEMKSTVKKSITVEAGWLTKIAEEALSHGQRPAVVLSFVKADGKPALPYHSEWVVLPKEVFKELLDK